MFESKIWFKIVVFFARTGTGLTGETSAGTDVWTLLASTPRGSTRCSRRYLDKVDR